MIRIGLPEALVFLTAVVVVASRPWMRQPLGIRTLTFAPAWDVVIGLCIVDALLAGPHVTANDAYDCDTAFKIYPNPAATHLKEKLDWLEGRHFDLFK